MPSATRFAHNGYVRTVVPLQMALPLTTNAETRYEEALGFQAILESAKFFTQVAGTGSGATRTVQISKNGTVIASVAITLAGTSDLGEETAVDLSALTRDQLTFAPSDVLKIGFPASGTAFTAGAGVLVLTFAQKPQTL